MTYIVNQTRVASLTINGEDYTSNLVSFQVTDASANRNGCITTTGSLVLGSQPGTLLEDYPRDRFRRGQQVILDMQTPQGAVFRHPRGLLYVVTTAWRPETNELEVTLGCTLALAALTDSYDLIADEVPIALDPAQQTFANTCAGFSVVGLYIWQNNTGTLEKKAFFADNSANWTSILGVTSTQVSPLAGTDAIPDRIDVAYQTPEDPDLINGDDPDGDDNSGLAGNDNRGKQQIDETRSYYYINYPVTMYERIPEDATEEDPDGNLDGIDDVDNNEVEPPTGPDDCGNTPEPPEDLGLGGEEEEEEEVIVESCTEGYQLKQTPYYVPANRVDMSLTIYDGPGGQQSVQIQEQYGPAIEANQQYFADKYVYCRGSWGTACNPNGSCPTAGLNQILLGKRETINFFGEGNELVRQVTDTYQTKLSSAQPADWRSGIVDGIPQDFDQGFASNYSGLYRSQRTETLYWKRGNSNYQGTTTYTSITSRGTGVKGNPGGLDALQGIKTYELRTSTTISALQISPDTVNSATTTTVDKEDELILGEPPEGQDPYVLKTSLPVPLFFEEGTDFEEATRKTEEAVALYGKALKKFIVGDAKGLQIGESMRQEVLEEYYPGLGFRYVDNGTGDILVMHMDATVWGVTQTESMFVTNGLWNGSSNGTVNEPHNLVGNIRPVFDLPTAGGGGGSGGGGGAGGGSGSGGGTLIITSPDAPTERPDGEPLQENDVWQDDSDNLYYWDSEQDTWVDSDGTPIGGTDPILEPGIDNETIIDEGSIYETVNVYFQLAALVDKPGDIVYPPIDEEEIPIKRTMTAWVSGLIVETGGLYDTNGSGSIPIEYNGVLVTSDANVVVGDLFA